MNPDTKSDLMTIREMCDAFDVTPRTLRFYEAKELISPIREGTKRLFTRRDRARLKLILRGKRFGFSLEDIRQTLDLYDRDHGDAAQRVRVCELARERLAEMQAQRAELDLAIAELQDALAHAAERGLSPQHAA
jgi:DNA-binding transcriptional MerR regulator